MLNKEEILRQINEILDNYIVMQSDEEIRKTCFTEDGFALIYASDLEISISPNQNVVCISTLNPIKTFLHDLKTWDEMSVLDFPVDDLDWIFWNENLKPALFEIIELLESPNSKPDHLPEAPEDETVIQLRKQVEELQGRLSEYEKPLEEQIKEWNEKRDYLGLAVSECEDKIIEQQNIMRRISEEYSIVQKQIEVLSYQMKKLNGKGTTNEPT